MYLNFLATIANDKSLQILDEKLDWDVTSKIRSLENVRHKAGGGDKKIFDDKEYLRCGCQKWEHFSFDEIEIWSFQSNIPKHNQNDIQIGYYQISPNITKNIPD